jgi:hypothetical protein
MNEPKKSDPATVAMKPTNKAGAISVAESVTQALGRVRQAAKARRKERFTAPVDRLGSCC